MTSPTSIGNPMLWAVFAAMVLSVLVLDLGVLHRKARTTSMKEAAWVTLGIMLLAGAFAGGIWHLFGAEKALQFVTGYVVEEALSVDNLFVFLVIFQYFKVPPEVHHRVLFWGIFGALGMRAVFIVAGTALVSMFHWIFYLFGIFLVLTGIKLLFEGDQEGNPADTLAVRLYKRVVPSTAEMHGAAFFVRQNGRLLATPLLLVLFVVEVSDILFAVDSIPAIFSVTTDPFLVYTSNVFAILGLRSLFFLLAGMMSKFHYLKFGLGGVLVFIGAKMLVADWYEIGTGLSLGVIALLLLLAVVASVLVKPRAQSPQ